MLIGKSISFTMHGKTSSVTSIKQEVKEVKEQLEKNLIATIKLKMQVAYCDFSIMQLLNISWPWMLKGAKFYDAVFPSM